MWLREVEIPKSNRDFFPFSIPLFSNGLKLEFGNSFTVIAGENGAGKSTFLESLACAIGFGVYGGGADQKISKVYIPNADPTVGAYVEKQEQNADIIKLADILKLTWNIKTRQGFFLRGEHYLDVASQFAYRERYLDVSHGEGMLAIIQDRFKDGIFILDEPETALSPIRQLELLNILMKKQREQKAQFIIATHSPILMALPGADFYYIYSNKFMREDYKNCLHFQIMKRFIENPERCLEWYLNKDVK